MIEAVTFAAAVVQETTIKPFVAVSLRLSIFDAILTGLKV